MTLKWRRLISDVFKRPFTTCTNSNPHFQKVKLIFRMRKKKVHLPFTGMRTLRYYIMEEFTSEPLCLSMEFIEAAFASQKEALGLRYEYDVHVTKANHPAIKEYEALRLKKVENTSRVNTLELEILTIQTELESYQTKTKEMNGILSVLVKCATRNLPIPDDIMLKCKEEVKLADEARIKNNHIDEPDPI